MKKPIVTVLKTRFDITQLGVRLTATTRRTVGDDQPVEGVFAGSLYFQQGEEFHIQIEAGAAYKVPGKAPFKNFEIVDFAVTTRPRVYSLEHETRKIVFPCASPFAELSNGTARGATTILPANEFVPADVSNLPPDYFLLGKKWNSFLTMGKSNARWLMTLLATVRIDHNDGTAEYRVMEIDPETEVGTGINPPP